jgi:hypothetical protein
MQHGNTKIRDQDMIQKIVKKSIINDLSSIKEDLTFWLNKSPEERLSAVEYLRRQHDGNTARLQRSARIIQLAQS